MPRKSRGFRRGSSRHGAYIWSAIVIDEIVASTSAPASLPIVLTADFTAAGIGQKSVTLLGIRGWLSIGQSVTNTSQASVFMAVVKHDDDIDMTSAEMNPTGLAFYTQENILWTGGWNNPGMETGVGNQPTDAGGIMGSQVNLKAKRKLKSGEGISLQLAATGASNCTLSGVLRAILLIS